MVCRIRVTSVIALCVSQLIGRTFLPPYWSLGFQLCRWGYNSLRKVKEVVAGMREYDIPQVRFACVSLLVSLFVVCLFVSCLFAYSFVRRLFVVCLLFACLLVCLPVRLFVVCLFACLLVSLPVCLFVRSFVFCLFACCSFVCCLFAYLFACFFACLFVCSFVLVRRVLWNDDELWSRCLFLQDVQYGDIDYMIRQLDFTFDPIAYDGLPDFVRSIRKDGLRYIIILVIAIRLCCRWFLAKSNF